MTPYRIPGELAPPLRPIRPAPWWLDAYLDKYRWYRRWRGGHWEQWWIDQIFAILWVQIEHGKRPICGRCHYRCEDYYG